VEFWSYESYCNFLKPNEHTRNDLRKNTMDSTQGTYLELHTWYPYENLYRCNPAKETAPIIVLTMSNLCEFRRSYIFRGVFRNNYHGCPIYVFIWPLPLLVYSTDDISYIDSKYLPIDFTEWQVKLVRLI
jgi:hypothetical protein